MTKAPILDISRESTNPTIFISIRNERTPSGNIFFRLDKLEEVYVCNNLGLTPELKISGGFFYPDATYEQFINFIKHVAEDTKGMIKGVAIYELVITEETTRDIKPRADKKVFTDKV